MVSRPAFGAASGTQASPVPTVNRGQNATALFQELDAKIEAAMADYHIPGVAVGVWCQGQEYVRGYGVTNVDYPRPVDGDTLFRIGSITKTITGTTAMRLVEQGRLDLNAPVRAYLPGLQLMDEVAAARVTVRQLFNHSGGWLGDYYPDFGRGTDALRRYVAGMQQLPQLTPVGEVFAYNNAAVTLAGHVIEIVADQPYEDAIQQDLLEPLGLDHSFFFSDAIVGYNVAASHNVVDGAPVVDPSWWRLWRTVHPTGGLISSARDQLRYARFQLGQVGAGVLSAAALRAMRADLGPGGTVTGIEINGVGVSFMQRPTAEGVPVYQHMGDWPGQHAGLMFVPARDFAMIALTNAELGPALTSELFVDDWALERFAGLHNPPAILRSLATAQLTPYEGEYWAQAIDPPPGDAEETVITMRAADGRLRVVMKAGATLEFDLGFYRDDAVLLLSTSGQPTPSRNDFVRGADGRVAWFRFGGRLHRHLD
jgi:CubicO group peptidase (beta-lactamase class C family)